VPFERLARKASEKHGSGLCPTIYKPLQETSSERVDETSPLPRYWWEGLIATGSALCAGAPAGWLLALLYAAQHFKNVALALTFCVPLVVGVFLLAGVLHIGMMGVVFRDWKREWWGRLGGWLLLFAIVWLVWFWLVAATK